jgi:hypothetical protein
MKDIDFDELDKAVNSLMTKAQKNEPSAVTATSDTPATQNIPPTTESDMPLTAAAPVVPGVIKPKSGPAVNPDVQPAITPEPRGSSTPPQRTGAPATRRGGKFMDMMPKKPATIPVSRPASREGATISPHVGADAKADVTKAVESETTLPQVSSLPQSSAAEKTAPKNDWPDPIEIATAKKPPTIEKEPETIIAEKPTQESLKDEEKTENRPLTSPFLPGAKVEKRPLGSPISNVPMLAPEAELQAPAPDDSEAQLPAKPSDVVLEMPDEFGSDVMQVEADTHMDMPKTESKPLEQEPLAAPMPAPSQAAGTIVPQEVEVKDVSPLKEEEASDKVEESPATDTPSASGRISIPPQYKEQPSTGEKESGAIYDTSTYHQPLMHPAKKKSGWLWVLWIVLILIVGAGAGVALYFLGIM